MGLNGHYCWSSRLGNPLCVKFGFNLPSGSEVAEFLKSSMYFPYVAIKYAFLYLIKPESI